MPEQPLSQSAVETALQSPGPGGRHASLASGLLRPGSTCSSFGHLRELRL